jgi:hypothetical protein
MENLGVFYDHLVYFTAIGNILWPFGIFCGNLVLFFPRFGILDQEKSGNPDFNRRTSSLRAEVLIGGLGLPRGRLYLSGPV